MMPRRNAGSVGGASSPKRWLKVFLAAVGICALGFGIWSLGFPQEQVRVLFRFDGEAEGDNLPSSVSTPGDVTVMEEPI